jgi:hypothetical protein
MESNETAPQKKQSLWQKITNTFRTKRSAQALLVVVFVALGIVGLGFSFAYTGTPSSPATTTCGARVANYTYKVPFGNAVWNQAACSLPVDSQSADYASRFWNYRNGNDLSTTGLAARNKTLTDFGFEALPSNFSRTVFNAKDANRTIQIQASVYDSNLDGTGASFSNLPKTSIPWNDAWVVGQAGDNEAVILNDQTGEIIYLAGVKKDLAAYTQCGPLFRERLCTYSVQVGRNPSGAKIDYRTYEGSTGDRGSGLSFYATLTTPEEVAAGEIRHALGMSIANTAFGPECTTAQLNTAAEGTTCGTAVAPASKFEWASKTKHSARLGGVSAELDALYTQKALIPEGSRFRLNVDDAYIENWINSRPDLKADTKKAETARIFARAMRDYGVVIVDTSGVSAIQVSGVLNPTTKTAWANLGINDISDNNLLNGLIGQDNVQLIAPPTNNCSNGTKSTFYCPYVTSSYPAVTTAPATSSTTTGTTSTTTTTTTGTTTGTTTSTTTTTQTTPPPVVVPSTMTLPGEFPVAIGWDSNLFEFRQGAALSWGASTSPKIITNYVVKKNGKVIYNGVNRVFTDFDLYAGQKYKYEFYAVDSVGNLSVPAIYERNYNCTWFGWSCSFSK